MGHPTRMKNGTGMKFDYQSRGLTTAQLILTIALCVFSLASIGFVVASGGEIFEVFYCLVTIPFVCLPLGFSLLFRWRLNTLFYLVFSFYAMGPILGAVYDLYYLTTWWDDLLHVLAGFLFAAVGAYLVHVLNRGNKSSLALCLAFGFCFSLGIAVVWEIFEYTSDVFLGSDMQADTIINTIITKVGNIDGSVTVISGINDVVVNGTPLNFGGYLDIGLIDTMADMTVETIGALFYVIYALIDREKHPMIAPVRKVEAGA